MPHCASSRGLVAGPLVILRKRRKSSALFIACGKRVSPAEPERPFRDHDAQRERAARQALAIGAVARIDQLRLFGDLIADRAALAAAGLRELHRPFLSGLVEGWCPGAGFVFSIISNHLT